MMNYYTNEQNILIVISLLKEHNIKKIIVSPGTTNVSLVASVQSDDFFEVYSCVDERSAAFMACGLSKASNEPVVVTCTGATASRNYIEGLTEAFYSHLPIISITFTQHLGRIGNYVAQVIDRNNPFRDLVKKSVNIQSVFTEEDKNCIVQQVNEVLLESINNVKGPVNINLVTTYSNNFTIRNLPKYNVLKIYSIYDKLPELPTGKIGIFVGNHVKFSGEETEAIDEFCSKNDAVVICDHTSNFKGKYAIQSSIVSSNSNILCEFDLLIYIGYVSGAYYRLKSKKIWRVSEDGKPRDVFGTTDSVFKMSEYQFFTNYNKKITSIKNDSLLKKILSEKEILLSKQLELPFSNLWIAKQTSSILPKNSTLHLAILNSLRSWNYFDVDNSILCYSNTGGFGIDGCVSSLIGGAIANPDSLHFGIIGDLAFFYDIDSLDISNLPTNIRIMIINNGVGTEFKNYNHRCAYFGDDADKFMAARGQTGNQSRSLIKNFVQNLNMEYLSADNKKEYLNNYTKWLSLDASKPIVFEIFVNSKDESDALEIINNLNSRKKAKFKRLIKQTFLYKIYRRVKGK